MGAGPDTLSQLFAGGTIGLRATGGILEARGAKTTADAISDAAKYNAKLARREASIEEARIRRRNRRALSSMRVSFAKAGVQMEGTPLEQMAFAASELERDAVNARLAGEATAALDESRAKNARTIGRQRASASLLRSGFDIGGFGMSLLRGG